MMTEVETTKRRRFFNVSNLSKRFGLVAVLTDISFSIAGPGYRLYFGKTG